MQTPDNLQNSEPESHQIEQPKPDQFLVCGLGSLGQHCVVSLKEFGVKVSAINLRKLEEWETANLSDLLEDLIIGDCRQATVLEQAKIRRYRCVLIVTSVEWVNAETALIIRKLSPQTRLVVRSSKENLNHLLTQQLGNFIAYEPTQLPAFAFALAALGTEVLGFFNLDGYRIQIIQRQLRSGDPWCHRPSLQDLNSRTRRILCHTSSQIPSSQLLHEWEPSIQPHVGDLITYIEIIERVFSESSHISNTRISRQSSSSSLLNWINHFSFNQIRQQVKQFWQKSTHQPIQRVALVCSFVVFILLIIGTLLFDYYYPDVTFLSALYAVAILLLGGYSDLF